MARTKKSTDENETFDIENTEEGENFYESSENEETDKTSEFSEEYMSDDAGNGLINSSESDSSYEQIQNSDESKGTTEQPQNSGEPFTNEAVETTEEIETGETEIPKQENLEVVNKPTINFNSSILKLDAKENLLSQEEIDNTNWHEIRNAYNTRKILTGYLDGLEVNDIGVPIAIISYSSYRILIPVKEMMVNTGDNKYTLERQGRILGSMIGCEIDFVIKGIDNKARSVVASRKDAMARKQRKFYLNTDENGSYMINEGQLVQGRITSVSERAIRLDIFGVETTIWSMELSRDWMGDVRDFFNVGDKPVVRILNINRENPNGLKVAASIKAVADKTSTDNIKKCKISSKYAGSITDIKDGIIFIRLNMGVNAIAHSCADRRTPGKNDTVSFVATKIDIESNVLVGLINRIIKQNI